MRRIERIDLKSPQMPYPRREDLLGDRSYEPDPDLARTAILKGIGVEGAAGGVVLASGSTAAMRGAIDIIRKTEDSRDKIWGLPYGYRLPSALAEHRSPPLKVNLLSNEMVDPATALSQVRNISPNVIAESWFVLDYPTNPTGESFPDALTEFVDFVSTQEGRVIVDLAYGGYLGEEEYKRIARLVLSSGGIISGSLKKFLKGPTGAFAILPEGFQPTEKTEPRVVEESVLYQALFDPEAGQPSVLNKMEELGSACAVIKDDMIEMFEESGLVVVKTASEVPIFLGVSNNLLLYTLLDGVDVQTLPSADFENIPSHSDNTSDGFGGRAVRMAVTQSKWEIVRPEIEVVQGHLTEILSSSREEVALFGFERHRRQSR